MVSLHNRSITNIPPTHKHPFPGLLRLSKPLLSSIMPPPVCGQHRYLLVLWGWGWSWTWTCTTWSMCSIMAVQLLSTQALLKDEWLAVGAMLGSSTDSSDFSQTGLSLAPGCLSDWSLWWCWRLPVWPYTLWLLTSTLWTLHSLFFFLGCFYPLQYNEELHYVEPCLNGTLVQADRTNKEVGATTGQEHQDLGIPHLCYWDYS